MLPGSVDGHRDTGSDWSQGSENPSRSSSPRTDFQGHERPERPFPVAGRDQRCSNLSPHSSVFQASLPHSHQTNAHVSTALFIVMERGPPGSTRSTRSTRNRARRATSRPCIESVARHDHHPCRRPCEQAGTTNDMASRHPIPYSCRSLASPLSYKVELVGTTSSTIVQPTEVAHQVSEDADRCTTPSTSTLLGYTTATFPRPPALTAWTAWPTSPPHSDAVL